MARKHKTTVSYVAANATLHVGIIEALVDSASDKSEPTRRAVFKALVDIGRKKYSTVLRICHSYLKKHGKVRSNE